MIKYLIDSSALWRLRRDHTTEERWRLALDDGHIGSCAAMRTEFLRSARNADDYDAMTLMFTVFADVPHPKTIWTWIESAQFRLVNAGTLRAFSPVDLMLCATAATQGLIILHDDKDFVTAARHLPDVNEQRI